jgi:hypothetical protein
MMLSTAAAQVWLQLCRNSQSPRLAASVAQHGQLAGDGAI